MSLWAAVGLAILCTGLFAGLYIGYRVGVYKERRRETKQKKR